MAAKGISGLGVAFMAAGGVIAWSGINNVPVLAALRALAKGEMIPSNKKPAFQPVGLDYAAGAAAGDVATGAASNSSIVQMAATVAASPPGRANYCWGGGHTANPCSAKCFDCSGYVSCVLNKLGLMKGSKTTITFMAWNGLTRVAWGSRQPGDLLINRGHMGIMVDNKMMWNAACTACGAVKQSSYVGKTYGAYRIRGGSVAGGVAGRSG